MKQRKQPSARPNGLAIRYGRLRFLAYSAVVLFLFLGVRLFQLQILQGREYAQKALGQQITEVPLASRRGQIVDRSGQELALELPQFYSLGAYPTQVTNPTTLCNQLASFTGRPVTHYMRRLRSPSKFIYLEWRLNEDQAAQLEKLNIGGLNLTKDAGRFYPYHEATSQLLGFTDPQGHGIAGLEVACDSLLQGSRGWETRQRDAHGGSFWDPLRSFSQPKNGGSVRLSIDVVAQEVLRDELEIAMEEFKSLWAGGVLVNPHTGEILAICSVPDFNPLRPELTSQADHKLRPVTDLIEPGSIFKVVAATAALDKDLFSLDEQIYCEAGAWAIGSRTLHDAHPYGWLSFEDVIIHSSNIGTAKIAARVGSREMYRYATRFGFGLPTGIEFPGEAAGQLRSYDEWGDIHRANIAIGQGVSVTMLQMAMAYSAIINDGILMEPRLILDVTDADGNHRGFPPKEISRVMEPQTARTLQNILIQTVERGTGKTGAIDSVVVGGKTGTAQIPNLTNGGYYNDRYVGSFIGFTTGCEEDRLLIVSIYDPKGVYYGALVAGPVFKRVIEKLIPLDIVRTAPKAPPIEVVHVQRDTNGAIPAETTEAAMSDLAALHLLDIARNMSANTAELRISTSGNTVPDLKGLSLRDAVRMLSERGIKYQISGTGWVVGQSLVPGSSLSANSICCILASPLQPGAADSLEQDSLNQKAEKKLPKITAADSSKAAAKGLTTKPSTKQPQLTKPKAASKKTEKKKTTPKPNPQKPKRKP
ncbi:MAG: penicillin-binding protein [bacterium]|nr:penicillin-binding protein [bacterium]